jgi:DNA polymerase/3'-5' exonuclease PolX
VACEANRALAEAFLDLSDFEFKASNKFGGIALKKAVKSLCLCEIPVTSGKQVSKLDGIGKSTVEKIDEFLATGHISRLEEFRAAGGDI